MKPKLLKLPDGHLFSFNAREDKIPNINNKWHYHAELELIHFHRGNGMQFVGDNMKAFSAGDIVLVGSNVPHFWKFESCEEEDPGDGSFVSYSTVVHFKEIFWGDCFFNLPEAAAIRSVIRTAQRGILIQEKDAPVIADEMKRICGAEGIERIISLLRCLAEFSHRADKTILLSSMGYKYDCRGDDSGRINCVMDYSLKNFRRTISLIEIASVASMAVNSFCRFFKTKTGKTYLQFLNELRVGYACKLLIENKHSVKHICFESGFNNFTSFHKIFKKTKSKTPQRYFKEYCNAE